MNQPTRGIGIVLIVVGILVLLGQLVSIGPILWPFFIVAPGVAMLAAAFWGRRSAAGLAVPGAIVTTVGLVLFLQALTGAYQTWSYAWGLIIAAVGAGIFLRASIEDNVHQQQEGARLTFVGLALFAAFGVFFEFFVFGDLAGWVWRYLLPLVLIVVGGLLLWRQRQGAS